MNQKKHILIVDDEADIRDLLRDIVETLGHDAEVAASGFEALAKLRLDIDLILLDVVMPGMDGYEVARRIRTDTDHRDIPIIMVTALTSRAERLRAVEAGVNDFIEKPADLVEVRVRMASLLNMKEAHDALKRYQRDLEDIVEKRTAALRTALEDMAKAQERAHAAHLDTIKRLALAAEYRDMGTGSHIQRVSDYAALLARSLNLPPGEVELIRLASPLHDVGKIGIPDHILRKRGVLTDEERELMEQHTLIGAHLLQGTTAEVLRVAEVVARTHHERWDGSGYPNKLAGEQIPLWGRICAVADVFDALTTDRPYRKALSNSAAFEILRSGRGKHFAPDLVDLFLEQAEELTQIQRRYKNSGDKSNPLPAFQGA